MSCTPLVPCPVRLGMIRTGGLPALLHDVTRERNLRKLEKLLKKGVDVDCVNNLGQTALFCASLLGYTNVVELLLQYGANPNHRCADGSTPVHAAVFSCKPWLLSGLLDAGGDLRLHDDQGRTPHEWADVGAQEHSPRMLDFLENCASHVWSLTQTHSARVRQATPSSSKTFLRSPSRLGLIRPGGSDLFINKNLNAVSCFGYGKLCIDLCRQPVGVLASVPLIADCDLVQAEDEALNSFTCGALCCMTNYSWQGCRVTVKELQTNTTQKHAEQDRYQDLLITEQEFCNRLFHPNLLQLMAVSITADLQQSRLVFERVHLGSLYDILHHRRAEFPVLKEHKLLAVVLQVCEALLYLHSRALVLRALSSHAVLIVHPGVAKVTGIGFTVPSEDSCHGNVSTFPLPAALYNWAAPEVIRRKKCTGKADLYSLCTLIQELYTDSVPWRCVDPYWIKQAVDKGQALSPDPAVPQPYYKFLQSGLQPQPKDRSCNIQDLRFILRCDLREFSKGKGRSRVGFSIPRWNTELRKDDKSEKPEIQFQPLENEMEQKHSPIFSRTLQNDESSSDAEEVFRDISCHKIPTLEKLHLSSCSSVFTEYSSSDVGSSSRDVEENLPICAPDSFSEYIRSIELNLKMSQVLLQKVEGSLAGAEQRLSDRAVYDSLGYDEVDDVSRKKKGKVVVLKAVGPPSTYRPLLQLQEGGWSAMGQEEWAINVDEEVSHYCSAVEESFLSFEGDRNVGSRAGERQQLPIQITEEPDSSYRSSDRHESQQVTTARPKWTNEVSEAVAQMTLGWMVTPAGPMTSSESKDVDGQAHLPVDRQNTHKDTELEHVLCKDLQSESAENVDFHTMQEFAEEEEESSLKSGDGRESPVEPSSIFYTPKHISFRSKTDHSEELSQTLSSQEDPEVTIEVIHPNTTVIDNQAIEECQSAPEEPNHPEPSKSAERALHTISQPQDVADVADLSSITCSPAQLQKWSRQNGAPPSPHSTRFPPCSSTPQSLATRKDHSPALCSQESVPVFMMDTSPWGSTSEQTQCSKLFATASTGSSNTIGKTTDPSQMHISLEEIDTVTTASSGTRHTPTEDSSQGTGKHATPGRSPEKMKGISEEEDEIDEERNSCVSEPPGSVSIDHSLDQTPDAAAAASCPVVVNNKDLMLNGSEISVPSANLARSSTAPELEETERAHSTLDEVLHQLLIDNQRVPAETISEAKTMTCRLPVDAASVTV